MNNFSDYIIYVDESGDHGLGRVDPKYLIFTLVFCIFERKSYISHTVPRMGAFKIKYWGHNETILHEHDIRKSGSGDYAILNDMQMRQNFITDLTALIKAEDFRIIAAVIHKDKLLESYPVPSNPYELALLFCMERAHRWLMEQRQNEKTVRLFCESRDKRKDDALELEFRRICDNDPRTTRSGTNFKTIDYRMRFLKKKANSTGLQFADLIARPIGLSVLRPRQPNRAFDIIEKKFLTHKDGTYEGKGLKVFP